MASVGIQHGPIELKDGRKKNLKAEEEVAEKGEVAEKEEVAGKEEVAEEGEEEAEGRKKANLSVHHRHVAQGIINLRTHFFFVNLRGSLVKFLVLFLSSELINIVFLSTHNIGDYSRGMYIP